MIPELVVEIGRIAQQGIQVSHYAYYRSRLSVALLPVGDGLQEVYHLVYVSAVFGQPQFFSGVIVVFIHKIQDSFRSFRHSAGVQI